MNHRRLPGKPGTNRRGSASALIVLMVVLLAVFGALALAGAASDLRLANRHTDWLTEYYRMDSIGVRLLARVDEAMQESLPAQEAIKRIEATELDGLHDVSCTYQDGALEVQAVVGDPEQRGIRILLVCPASDGTLDAGGSVDIRSWAQFQQPFEYGTEPGDLWDGEES